MDSPSESPRHSIAIRRSWIRSFPDGNIEFMLVTRVLALLMLVVLAVVPESQGHFVLSTLAVMVWVDHVLMLGWMVQTKLDLRKASDPNRPDDGGSARELVLTTGFCALPSLVVMLMVSPWLALFIDTAARRRQVLVFLIPVLLVIFVVFLVLGARRLKKLESNGGLWTALLLVPGLHWFAIQRMLKRWEFEINAEHRRRDEAVDDEDIGSLSLSVADVTWFLMVVPWLIIAVVGLVRGGRPEGFPYVLLPSAAMGFTMLFGIANTAALEHVQKRFVTLFMK